MSTPIRDDDRLWDVVIVGTGMGGGTLGHALARQGRSVLFLERGEATLDSIDANIEIGSPDERMRAGRWPERITTIIDGEARDIFAAMGCGVGGSTRLYAAALERFEPHDFAAWPIDHAALAPFYAQAETLYAVRGTRDPLGEALSPDLRRPPAMAPADGVLMRDFARAGLHPYRLHVGIGYRPGCDECLGRVCPRACKSDSDRNCVAPALASGHAELRTRSEVVHIESDDRRVTGIVYRHEGELRRAHGRIVALSAGALASPALLLSSGLGNSSGLVGRNLMFHGADWIAVWPSRKASPAGPRKTIALRDFYARDGTPMGSLQSTGLSAGYGNVLMFLYRRFDASRWRWLRPLRPFLRIPAKIAAKLFGSATILATILEDRPYAENRVEIDPERPGRIRIHYRIHDELAQRARAMRAAIDTAMSANLRFWLNDSLGLNDGHPCGTCRFGSDPTTSVLDPYCRTHDIDNLFVVDASFMPSSGGANPSLTIAANALRVAEAIGAQLDRSA